MDDASRKKIYACIVYLESQGYVVSKRGDSKVGMWIAFRREGMEPVQHGRITQDCIKGFMVKRKNGRSDYVGLDNVLRFFDNRRDCYNMKA